MFRLKYCANVFEKYDFFEKEIMLVTPPTATFPASKDGG